LTKNNNLKVKLEKIKKSKINPREIKNFNELIDEMIKNIGNPDPILRDDLIYSLLANWIISGHIDDKSKKDILNRLISEENLFYKIDAKEDVSIFKRSFSVLMIPSLIYSHRQKSYLTKSEVREAFNAVCKYFALENDLRGYIKSNGWAHSAAHTADALDELALCKELDKIDLEEILDLIKNKISNNSYIFINEEDERMCTTVESVMSRNLLSDDHINSWLESFYTIFSKTTFPDNYIIKMNQKSFLRSLYFRFLEKDKITSEKIHEILKKINS